MNNIFVAYISGIPMHVLNTEYFGQVMIPLDWHHNIHLEEEQFLYMRNEALGKTLSSFNARMRIQQAK